MARGGFYKDEIIAGLPTRGAHVVIITGPSFRAQGPQHWEEVHIESSTPA